MIENEEFLTYFFAILHHRDFQYLLFTAHPFYFTSCAKIYEDEYRMFIGGQNIAIRKKLGTIDIP